MRTLGQTLSEAAESAAKLILDGGYVERWVEGCIFPSEMAFFIAACETNNVLNVLESGRQDGYSTEILADWASRLPGRKVISIDLETDRERAEACRARLGKWRSVELVRGNAYAEFGRVANGLAKDPARKTAFLVDGPKKAPAISMMAAAIADNVAIIASHNLIGGSQDYDYFFALGGKDIFFESALSDPGPLWQELRRRDAKHAMDTGAARSIELSSIGVLTLDAEKRRQIRRTGGSYYGLHQPAAVRGLWKLGAYNAAPLLYGLSYRLLRR